MNDYTLLGHLVDSEPDSVSSIKKHAEDILVRAGAVEVFPTPVEQIIAAAELSELDDIEEAKEFFLKTVSKDIRKSFLSGWNKIRGFADLKKKVIFSKPEELPARQVWPKLHEVSHQILPWQAEVVRYLDDDKSLSPSCEEEFELEANFCAGEFLFQGKIFSEMSQSYRPDFGTIFFLADKFGASRQATARKFMNENDEAVALISYYRSKYSFDENGRSYFRLGKAHSVSRKMLKKYSGLHIPDILLPTHPWISSYNDGEVRSEAMLIESEEKGKKQFLWESWWNGYNLLVFLREKPSIIF